MAKLFEVDEIVTPAAQALAKGFLKEANQELDRMLNGAYDAIDRFWFRNVDENGTKIATASKTDPQPTGPEILEAMGTDAARLMTEAYERVQFVAASLARAGKAGEMDASRLALPYDLVWNDDDGSLKTATLAQWYVDKFTEEEPPQG